MSLQKREKDEILIRVICDTVEEAKQLLEEIKEKVLPSLQITGLSPSNYEHGWRGYAKAFVNIGVQKLNGRKRKKE